jgi:hypothetical protein
MTIANDLIKAITASSRNSARSNQTAIGPSEIFGCRRATWNRINNVTKTNPNTLALAGIMGTAIHSYIQQAFNRQDPFGDRYLLEEEVEYEGLMGHIDMFDKVNQEVVDWKTVKKANLSYFPSEQQRSQVQIYGYLLSKNNVEVKTVTLVAIPRDGDERDINFYSEPYDESVALKGLEWLKGVKAATEPPEPERDAVFCQHYCVYFDKSGTLGCAGKGKAQAEGVVIEDEEARSAARDYLEVASEIDELEKLKEGLKLRLEGVSGVTPEGIKIAWSEVAGRRSVDEVKVKELLGEVPVKYGNSYTKLTVKEG